MAIEAGEALEVKLIAILLHHEHNNSIFMLTTSSVGLQKVTAPTYNFIII